MWTFCDFGTHQQDKILQYHVTGSKEIVLIIVDQSEYCVRWRTHYFFCWRWLQAFTSPPTKTPALQATNDHKIDFGNSKIIDKGNYRHRLTLESWHTAITTNADNNSKHLPEQYRFLLERS
jgi:hypothetical protein